MNRRRSSLRKHPNFQGYLGSERIPESAVNLVPKSFIPQERSQSFNITSDEWWIIDGNYHFVPDKFLSLYQDYGEDQAKLNKVWEKVEIIALPGKEFKRHKLNVLHADWKSLIRKGIPLNKFRVIILEIFKKTHHNVDIEYKCALEVAFRGHAPDTFKNVPLFTDSKGLETVLYTHFLNLQGLEAFKRIMWVFQKNVPRLEYSPILPQIVSLMLVFLKEEEAYVITKMILEDSDRMLNLSGKKLQEAIGSLRWHVTFKKEEFAMCLALIPGFCRTRNKKFSKLEKHFEKIGFRYEELFGFWLRNLFLNFFPLHIVLRIFGCYLNEGIKVYYKFAYSFLMLFSDEILNHQDPDTLIHMLKDKALNLTRDECDKLMGKAYARRLGAILRGKTKIPKVNVERHEEETIKYYLPKISEPSAIIDSHQLETIWEWMPDFFKPFKPVLAYSTKKHGWSLQTLYLQTREKKSHGMLLLIKTDNKISFGAFIDSALPSKKDGNSYTGLDDCFVFQLSPEEKKYASTKKNKCHFLWDSEHLSIGSGEDGPAIYLNQELFSGFSYRSETYNNDQLNKGEDKHNASFSCSIIEVYLLE